MGLFTRLTLLLTGLLWLNVTGFGSADDTMTIPCSYAVHKNAHSMCWGRGSCPYSSCNNVILQTDGNKVTWRKADRYQLMGNIGEGNVSLSISEVTLEDAGTYCCRVEIPGWFNDLKHNIDVEVQEGNHAALLTALPTPAPVCETIQTPSDTPHSPPETPHSSPETPHSPPETLETSCHHPEATQNTDHYNTDPEMDKPKISLVYHKESQSHDSLTKVVHKIKKIHEEEVTSNPPACQTELTPLSTQSPAEEKNTSAPQDTGDIERITHHKSLSSQGSNFIRATLLLGLTLLLLIIMFCIVKKKGQGNVILKRTLS